MSQIKTKIKNMSYEEKINRLKQIYRLEQLQGAIPFTMTFEEYLKFMMELYNKE